MKNLILLIALITITTVVWSQTNDANFKIKSVTKLDKNESLADEERNTFCNLSEEQWNNLPLLVQVRFEYEPFKGNTEDMGDTFYLSNDEMALQIGDEIYPAIGILSPFGFDQTYSSNWSPNISKDNKLIYGKDEMSMWFLIPEDAKSFNLIYKGISVAKGTIN